MKSKVQYENTFNKTIVRFNCCILNNGHWNKKDIPYATSGPSEIGPNVAPICLISYFCPPHYASKKYHTLCMDFSSPSKFQFIFKKLRTHIPPPLISLYSYYCNWSESVFSPPTMNDQVLIHLCNTRA